MAGHSKWANIKRRKAVVDAKRGKLFTKASKEIIVAARLGGGDPDGNARLRMAIENARAVSMPVDTIKRAILRGTGELEGTTYEDVTYEGYGPGGVAIIVVCTTDHRNRTTQELRASFSKYSGNLGETNSVSWNFTRRGEIRIETTKTEDELLLTALDVGAEDVVMIDDGALVFCSVDTLGTVGNGLASAGLNVREQRIVFEPGTMVSVSDADSIRLLEKFLDVLDDYDDVQEVFHNADLPDED
ncbi:MAG: YebC/PmpR family DNA-binding transcriptional regulator [Candidatus Kapabacteria bacterium]|nr:YebC/PmpR family DNA-binding transcriptional regulator [Candidatus Kapabacteria bacterium]